MRLSTIVSALVAIPGLAAASEYKPVRCEAAKTYEGRPLRAQLPSEALSVAGPLAGALDPATVRRLETALQRVAQGTRAQALTVAVARPGVGSWSGAWRKNPTAGEDPLFWWASVGKVVTAVVVLQLAEEGRLSLSDPISQYIPGAPNGRAVTLAHLLEHTAGLFSANEDRAHRAAPGSRTLSDDLVVLRRHGAMFCPGQAWRYTNTGYSLLGAVIEKVEGRPFHEVAKRRVLDRLGPSSLRMLSPNDRAADVAPLAPENPRDPVIHPSWAGPAGSLVGRAADVNRLLQAVLGSELLRPETTRAQFARLYPMFDGSSFYGRGVMTYEPTGTGILWLGHGGGSPGAKAITVWSPADRAFVSVALTGDGPAEAGANLLLKALGKP